MTDDKVRKEFGKRLTERMLHNGWNQSELARRADIGRDNVSGYIRGKNLPNSAHLDKLAKALRVEPSYLLGAAFQDRFPSLADDGLPVFRMEELPDDPEYVQVAMKKKLTKDQYRRLLDLLEEGREASRKR